MTLRVIVQIIPFGDEAKARTVETLNISNTGNYGLSMPPQYEYIIEHNEYKSGKKDLPKVLHNRDHGALELVRKAIERVLR